MTTLFADTITLIKPREQGVARIVHDTPSAMDRLQGALHGQPLTATKYCRLLVNGGTVMTDAEFEKRTNVGPIMSANGDALIAGLGIGLILPGIIERCKTVTVIEKEADVISLVAKHFPKVRVIHDDIFKWNPPAGAKYDFIYFDIWPDINADDLTEARTLHRKFRRYLKNGGYMQSWCRLALNALRR